MGWASLVSWASSNIEIIENIGIIEIIALLRYIDIWANYCFNAIYCFIWTYCCDYGHILVNLGVPGLQLAVSCGVLEVPWAGLGLILEPVGIILGCLGHQKVVQSAPGCHSANIVETYENSSVFIGLRGWRLPRSRQNGILDTLVAPLGCLD